MVNIKNQILKALSQVTGISSSEISLEFSDTFEHGDYTSNIALKLSSSGDSALSVPVNTGTITKDASSAIQSKTNPHFLAQQMVSELNSDTELAKYVDKIEVAGPGFINFFISKDILIDTLIQMLDESESFFKGDLLKGQKIVFEYGQPNTHKLPHIGHLFSYIYGESTSRILEANGAEVIRANYQGDIGLHVAKCLWAYLKNHPEVPNDLADKVSILQKMYQEGSSAYLDNESSKLEITALNKKLYEHDSEIEELWKQTREWCIEYYKNFEKRLGIAYNRSYFESEVYKEGIDIVNNNLDKVFNKSEGAIIFKGSEHGLHDRVFMTQYGTPTYEAKDMALQTIKMRDWNPDKIIITTASEQNEYFKVVFKALETLNNSFLGKLKHIGFGMVQLKSGKLSSRTGEIIGGIDLVDTVVKRIEEILQSREGLSAELKHSIAEIVGIGAVKYSFLKSNALHNVKFDIDESISEEGNSGPYIQYTYARIKSVLAKAKTSPNANKDVSISEQEARLIRNLCRFNGTIENAAKSYSPSIIAEYTYNLAREFNSFYNAEKIIGSENEEFRLAIIASVAKVLKKGLGLLGIESPEKM